MPTPPEVESEVAEAAPALAVVPQPVGLHGAVVAFDPMQELERVCRGNRKLLHG